MICLKILTSVDGLYAYKLLKLLIMQNDYQQTNY